MKMSIIKIKLRFMRLVIFFVVSQIATEKTEKEKKEDRKQILYESFEILNGINSEIECIEQEEKS